MSKEIKSKKGKVRRALKKVLSCCVPWTTSKVSAEDDDVYKPSTKAQMISTPSSSETQKVSESPAPETQKTSKGFMARLKGKMGRKKEAAKPKPPKDDVHEPSTKAQTVSTPSSSETQKVSESSAAKTQKTKKGFLACLKKKMNRKKTVLDQPKPGTQLGDAGMISGSESSVQMDTDILKYHPERQRVHTYFISKYESGDSDEEQSMSPSASFTYFRRGFSSKQSLSMVDDLVLTSLEEEEEELMQDEILGLNNIRENMGFPNIENTCYINSTLQCLLGIPAIIKDIVFQENQWKNVPGSEMFKAFSDLHSARLHENTTQQKLQLLAGVKDHISRNNPDFDGDDEQDAHEFLMALLAELNEEAKMCQQLEKSFHSPAEHLEFRVKRTRTCKTCGNQSCSSDEFNCLPLVIGPQKSLIGSLQQYFAASTLEYTCGRCKGEQASTHVEIQTLPKVLVLLMTRFDMLTAEKIQDRLAVPLDLSLSSFIGSDSCEQAPDLQSKLAKELQQQDDATYKLSGVVSHYGSGLDCGHYISNIRDPSGPGWLRCNDSMVRPISWSKASNTIENHGYMFFYLKS